MTKVTRTQDEIVKELRKRLEENESIAGFFWEFEGKIFADFLNFDSLMKLTDKWIDKNKLLEEGKEKIDKEAKPCTKETILKEMKDYMPFAFDKACGARGISANRSIQHFLAWIWLLKDEEFYQKVKDEYDNNYKEYGLPILKMIAKHYGFDITCDEVWGDK